jgi:uncharacterized membrane protein YhaH (DUF805 family)
MLAGAPLGEDMDNLLANYMGFDGRLNRQKWWISAIILAVAGFIVSWVLGLVFGTGLMIDPAILTDPAALNAYLQKAGWIGLITGIILAYPYIAITVKRRHDRNNNGYDAMGLIALQIVVNLLSALGLTFGVVGQVLGVILGIYAIYILVVVGFLKGTAGPNSYGPDPLQG